MAKLIQFQTDASRYDGAFGGSVGWPAAGMGYVILSDNGRLIVIDGGNTEDAEALVTLFEKYSKGKPYIEKWIITHPHEDHYFALREICAHPKLYRRIRVNELIYNFPKDFTNDRGEQLCTSAIADMEHIASILGADIKCPKYNEVFKCTDLELQFIYVPDDLSIFSGQQNLNVCSLIFTLSGKSKKVMFTGDAFKRTLQLSTWRFGKELKCDILQVPHHGLCDTGLIDFYKHVNAPILLVPISKAGHRSMHSGEHKSCDTEANLWAEANAETIYNAFDGNAELEI